MATGPVVLPSDTAPSPDRIRREFDLPSGKHVVMLKGTGRDQRLAATVVGDTKDPLKIQDALASRLCLVDGKKIRMEDVDDMEFDDAMVFRAEVGQLLRPLLQRMVGILKPSQDPATDQSS
jgi:hypothetical protein